jgi:hypothetical protein
MDEESSGNCIDPRACEIEVLKEFVWKTLPV